MNKNNVNPKYESYDEDEQDDIEHPPLKKPRLEGVDYNIIKKSQENYMEYKKNQKKIFERIIFEMIDGLKI